MHGWAYVWRSLTLRNLNLEDFSQVDMEPLKIASYSRQVASWILTSYRLRKPHSILNQWMVFSKCFNSSPAAESILAAPKQSDCQEDLSSQCTSWHPLSMQFWITSCAVLIVWSPKRYKFKPCKVTFKKSTTKAMATQRLHLSFSSPNRMKDNGSLVDREQCKLHHETMASGHCAPSPRRISPVDQMVWRLPKLCLFESVSRCCWSPQLPEKRRAGLLQAFLAVLAIWAQLRRVLPRWYRIASATPGQESWSKRTKPNKPK